MKTILGFIALICTSASFATVIDLQVFSKDIEIKGDPNFIRIEAARVKTIPSVVDRVENPNFDSFSGEPVYFETVLKFETVVEVRISYEFNDGSLNSEELTMNLPLSDFSEEELMKRRTTYRAVKNKFKLVPETKVHHFMEEYCADMNFDDFNNSLDQCNRIATRPSQATTYKLVLVNR